MTQFQGRAAPIVLLCDGQSLNGLHPDPPDRFVDVLAATLGAPSGPQLENWISAAAFGQLVKSMESRLLVYRKAGIVSVYTMLGGLADIQNGADAATTLARMEAIADAAHSAGVDHVVAGTVTPSDALTGGQETIRLAANSLILTNTLGKFDATVDLDAIPDLDNPASADYLDGTHWDIPGASKGAGGFADEITPLLAA